MVNIPRVFVTAVATLSAGAWGYAIPSYVTPDWRWRLLALPAGALCGTLIWLRYKSRPVIMPSDNDMSTVERVALTILMALFGASAGIFLPVGFTGSFPGWTVVVPLSMLLASLMGFVTWHHPALFLRNRRF